MKIMDKKWIKGKEKMRIALFIALLLGSMAAFAGEETTEVFTLDHQITKRCEKKIKKNLRSEKGVSKIDVSLKENIIFITYDKDETDPSKLIQGFKKIGLKAFIMGCEPTTHEEPYAVEIPAVECE